MTLAYERTSNPFNLFPSVAFTGKRIGNRIQAAIKENETKIAM